MVLKLIGLVAVIAAGFGLGATHLRVRLHAAVLAVVVAVLSQATLESALPHEAIERFAEAHAYEAGGLVLVLPAVAETAGLWTPVALLRWTGISGRVWGTVYVLGAAMLAAAVYYFPFDVVIANDKRLGPTHPSYELHLIPPVPFAAIG